MSETKRSVKALLARGVSSADWISAVRRSPNLRLVLLPVVLLVGACNSPSSNAGASVAPGVARERSPAVPPGEASTPIPSSDTAPLPLPVPSVAVVATPPGVGVVVRTFERDAVDAVPAGFSFARTGSGPLGRWLVQVEKETPNRQKILAQLDTDPTGARYPLAVLDEPSVADVRLTVRCKMISGRIDQACGIVARYQDENNYFITRANALENNIRLYTVQNGERHQLASYRGVVTPNVWHDLRLEMRGAHLQVYWDGKRVLDHHDATFPTAGRVGVWTKADSVTYFDAIRIEAL